MNQDQLCFQNRGYALIDRFLDTETSHVILSRLKELKASSKFAQIEQTSPSGKLKFFTLNGNELTAGVPEIGDLNRDVNLVVNSICGRKYIPFKDKAIGISVNVTPPNGEFKSHYDRNAITAVIYLNEVAGGEMECYPRHRILLPNRYGKLNYIQTILDRITGTKLWTRLLGSRLLVQAAQGRMLLFEGNKCLHRVHAVRGEQERYSIQLAYEHLESAFSGEMFKDYYGYKQRETAKQIV